MIWWEAIKLACWAAMTHYLLGGLETGMDGITSVSISTEVSNNQTV